MAQLTGGTAIKYESGLFEAFADRIFVRPKKIERVSEGGIALPDTYEDNPYEGEVVSIGGDVSQGVRVGMQVIFTSFSGVNVELDDEKFVVIRERDIIAVRV